MTEIGNSKIQVGKADGHAIVTIPEKRALNVIEAEAVMCDLIDAIMLAREIDKDPLPEYQTV